MVGGRFPLLGDRDDLWRLLAVITIRKARDQLERQAALKRGGGWLGCSPGDLAQWGGDGNTYGDTDNLDRIVGREPSPELASMMADEYLRLGADLAPARCGKSSTCGWRATRGKRLLHAWGVPCAQVGRKLEMIRMALAEYKP